MKTTGTLSVTLLVVLSAANAQADEVTIPSHDVHADGAKIVEAVPGWAASQAHPEGTVLGLAQTSTQSSFSLVEVDVANGTVLHRAKSISCRNLLHEGNRVYGACADEIVAFDSATLDVVWRTRSVRCPEGEAWAPVHLASNGTSRVVVAYECTATLVLRVVNLETGAMLGGVDTAMHANSRRHRDLVRLSLHGNTVFASSGEDVGIAEIVVLSPDYNRVAHKITFGPHQGVWDDGARLHATGTPPTEDDLTTSNEETGARVPRKLPPGPAWLVPDRDYVLSDALAPVSWTKAAPEVDWPLYEPSTGGGDYIDYHFQVGREHFWMARACCGSGATDTGLYAGKEE